jgi:hypothetical protein
MEAAAGQKTDEIFPKEKSLAGGVETDKDHCALSGICLDCKGRR